MAAKKRAQKAEAVTEPSPNRIGGIDRILFWVLMATVATGRLIVALANYRSLIAQDILQDDAFYYFKIASNLVSGHGMTFDGQTATTGFHPLLLFLLTPIYRLTQPDLVLPIYVAGVLLSAFAVATGWAVFALIRAIAGSRPALFGLALWAVTPYFIVFGLNGQETGLAMFFGIVIVFGYMRLMGKSTVAYGAPAGFGIVCGLAILARLDLVLLLVAIVCDWARRWIRGNVISLTPRHCMLAIFTCMLVWLPWGIACKELTGGWLPSSGAASRQIALSFGWCNLQPVWDRTVAVDGANGGKSTFFDIDSPPLAYRADVATKAIFTFLFENPLLAPLRFNSPWGVWPDLNSFLPYRWFVMQPVIGTCVLVLLILVLLLVIHLAIRSSRLQNKSSLASLETVVGLYTAFLIAAYVFYSPSHWYFSRYLTVQVLLCTIYIICLVSSLMAATRANGIWKRAAVGAGVLVLVGCQLMNLQFFRNLSWRETPPNGLLGAWESLQSHIDKSQRIGAFQSGIIGYFSGMDVTNLDGKVNPAAYDAIRDQQLHKYIVREHITYIMDWDWVVYALCMRYAGNELRLKLVARDEQSHCSLFTVEALPEN